MSHGDSGAERRGRTLLSEVRQFAKRTQDPAQGAPTGGDPGGVREGLAREN